MDQENENNTPTFTVDDEPADQTDPKSKPPWWRYGIAIGAFLVLVATIVGTGWFLGLAALCLFFPLPTAEKPARLVLRGVGVFFLIVALVSILPYLAAYSRCGGQPYFGSKFAATFAYRQGMATLFFDENKYYCTEDEVKAAGYGHRGLDR